MPRNKEPDTPKPEDRIVDEPGMAERFQRATEGAQHTPEAPDRANTEAEGAAHIKGARSPGENTKLGHQNC
jgi:hypothetical protein